MESLSIVLGREPAPDDPLTVTIKEAQRLSSLSRPTIGRMITRGIEMKGEAQAA